MLARFLYLYLIFNVLASFSYSQSYNIIRYSVRDGLLHSLVTGVAQDKRGDMWFSTGGGLCRFNGVEFDFITTKEGLSFTRLTCVTADDDDNIWVGSSKGLNFIKGKTILSVEDSMLGQDILTISSAGNSMIWAVANNGLFKVEYHGNRFIVKKISIPEFHSSEQSPIFQDRVHSSFIYRTKKGVVFYGNNGELFCIEDEIIKKVISPPTIVVNAGLELFDSSIIFGTNQGLYKLEGENLVPFPSPKINKINIKSLGFDGDKVWILGINSSHTESETNLYAIDLNNSNYFIKIGKSNGLTDEPTQMFIDHEGNLWATSNNGISLLRGNTFMAYTTNDGLIGNKIWGINRTKDGSLWVGTIGEGLTIIRNNQYLKYNTSNGLPDNYIGKVYQSQNGEVLFGTSNAGLCKGTFNYKSISYTFSRLPLLPDTRYRVDDIVEDKQGVLWVATSKGLYFSSNQKVFSHLPLTENDTGQYFIQKLLIDTLRNTMWVGTRYNGVFSVQNNMSNRFERINANEEISSLALDNLGDIWIGTRNNGAFRYDGTSITNISEKEGLASNLIYILHPDRLHNLWIGTNLGLNRIDLRSLKHNGSPLIRHYGSNEGLIDLEMNLNGVLEDDESGFWIATNGGLLRYDRRADKHNSVSPIVRIVSLKLNSQETDWQKYSKVTDSWNGLPEKLKLNHSQNHLTFEFVGVSFKNPKSVMYQWMLQGFDEKWITSNSRQAIYSNIPPGTYVFKLRAANNDMVWSQEVHSMPFTIKPPFWQTWWFRILIILIVFLGIYIYILSRVKSLKDKQKELKNLVDIRTLELREQFKIVDEQNKKIVDSLNYAKFLQNAMLTSIEEIKANFSDAFVYYRPKDIVSGDFYWFTRYNNISVFAVADCTGHGVPGAIISIICENALRQAVMVCYYENPAKILFLTNKNVIDTFTQTHKEIHHGMEIALCTFNHKTYELTYSGAKLGMYIASNGELQKYKPSIHRIGWDLSSPNFTNETIPLKKGDVVYLFTDGYGDQFEPKNRKKLSSARLKQMLLENSGMPLKEIYKQIDKEFKEWKGNYEQIDDVLVVGIKV